MVRKDVLLQISSIYFGMQSLLLAINPAVVDSGEARRERIMEYHSFFRFGLWSFAPWSECMSGYFFCRLIPRGSNNTVDKVQANDDNRCQRTETKAEQPLPHTRQDHKKHHCRWEQTEQAST